MHLDNTKIGTILNALQHAKTADVAKAIAGLSEKPLRHALKAAGYDYRNKAPRGWHYIGDGEKPIDKDIFDFVARSEQHVKRTSPQVHTDFIESEFEVTEGEQRVNTDAQLVHMPFTQREITGLMEMLNEWQKRKKTDEVIEVTDTIHDQIKTVPQADKVRKTIVIDKAIGERLDAFCDKERVNKSDVMYLALQVFLNKNG